MGWLRDLMKAARPPLRSFDELARKCLEHTSWPTEFRMQGRSLGTLLGKFDRELELEWLAHRPGAQRTLALVLGTSREQVLSALDVKRASPGRYVRLDDLPSGRLLDLHAEPLFPGLPPEVLTPGEWNGVWWLAPSGAGRTLVGRWLRARGLLAATDVTPGEGRPHYLELDEDRLLEPRPGLCVASPLPPRAPGFRVVRSAPLTDSAPKLVDWAVDRLPEGGPLDVAALKTWIAALVAQEKLESAGALLGLVGLADEHGVAELSRRSPRELMRLHLRRRAGEQLDPEAPATAWMKRSAPEALIALLRHLLSESDEPWWRARTQSEWAELLPAELRREADVEWLSLSLSRPGSAIRPSDVQRAARELPPGAFRLLRSFERTGVLVRSSGADTLALRPHWLVALALDEAVAELSRASPAEWGEALLRPYAAVRVASAVALRAARADGGLIDDVTDVEPGESPALCAATELALRAVGLAALASGDAPAENVDVLFAQALELGVAAPGSLPRPRIEHATEHALLSRGSYYLAAWALSEGLLDVHGRAPAALCPWATGLPANARGVLDEVLSALEARPELGVAAALLVARLPGRKAGHPLELPSALIAERSFAAWSAAASSPFAARVSAALVRRDPGLVASVWRDWEGQGRPDDPAFTDHELGPLWWRHAPDGSLVVALEQHESAYAWLGDEQWRTVVAELLRRGQAPSSLELWQHVPARGLSELLAAGLLPADETCLRLLWRREPGLVQQVLWARFFAQPGGDCGPLLATVPPEQSADLAGKLAEESRLGSLGTRQLWELQGFLHGLVGSRAPGWRSAYSALTRLERRLAAVRRASL